MAGGDFAGLRVRGCRGLRREWVSRIDVFNCRGLRLEVISLVFGLPLPWSSARVRYQSDIPKLLDMFTITDVEEDVEDRKIQ